VGQVTIYLADQTEAKMRAAADGAGLSKSKWIAKLIEACVEDRWPESVRNLVGAWADFPEVEELRSTLGEDAPRESF